MEEGSGIPWIYLPLSPCCQVAARVDESAGQVRCSHCSSELSLDYAFGYSSEGAEEFLQKFGFNGRGCPCAHDCLREVEWKVMQLLDLENAVLLK